MRDKLNIGRGRLRKPRTVSVSQRMGTETQIGAKKGRFGAENRDAIMQDIPRGIYFGVSVEFFNEH